MSFTIKTGATLSGGTDRLLTSAGLYAGGKASFTAPTHTRLAPRLVDLLVSPPIARGADPGVARAGAKIMFADRQQSEGCCTVQPGSMIIDVGARWHLSQPETLADDAIAYLQGLVFHAAFIDAIKKGILPT